MSLSAKQSAFIEHYLRTLNASEAARLAGYSERSAASIGSENLTKPKIREAIEKRMKLLAMSADEVLIRLTMQARSNIGDYLSIHDYFGTPTINLSQARDKLHLIKSIEIKPTKHGHDIKLELYDAQNALIQLGRYHKLFTDKVQIDDWRSQAIEDIKAGRIDFHALAAVFDRTLAEELFIQAGVTVSRE